MEPGRIPHRQIHDAALAESNERVARRQLDAVDQVTRSIDDVVHRTTGYWAWLHGANPEIAISVGTHGIALRQRRTIVRQLGVMQHADLAHGRWRRRVGVRDGRRYA